MQQIPFALFDFDDTVSHGDSIVPYVLFCARKGYATRMHVVCAAVRFALTKLGVGTVDAAKAYALSFLKGRDAAEITQLAHEFWREVLVKRLFPEAIAEMKRLRESGCRVLIVSASVTAYMDVLPEYVPADAVLATACGTDGDGRLNGCLGENCRGLQKPLRIAEYLAANNLLLDYDASYAFGDSPSDEPMLRTAAHATLVNPPEKLRAAMPDAAVVHWKKA